MPGARPNILLIVIDCLRADRTFDPDRSAQTPGLHALAERGVLFSHLITANSMTIPCMTTMFTGMYPARHGVRAMVGARVADEVPLLAEVLRENGYHTYAEVSGPLSAFYRLDRGFDHYELRDGVKSSLLGEWGDQLIARLRDGEFHEPWFAYLHLWGVHRPRQILPEFNKPEYGHTEYDRAISSYDARLRELFRVIDEDNTIILVTGDHGEKIPENNLENRVEFLKKSLSKGSTGKASSSWVRMRRKAVASLRAGWFSAKYECSTALAYSKVRSSASPATATTSTTRWCACRWSSPVGLCPPPVASASRRGRSTSCRQSSIWLVWPATHRPRPKGAACAP